jgi:LmbE family N-acetylglucosaminyl deacetylase
MTPIDETALRRSTLVFAPHPDDEVLGCGGLIHQKKKAGADLKIVFMTDGARSHAHLMPESQMKSIREAEGRSAAQVLGLDASDVIYLAFRDQTLSAHQQQALKRVRDILLHENPDDIFIPYRHERPADHRATYDVVLEAIKQTGYTGRIYAYPIWFWYHWPWVPVSVQGVRNRLRMLRNTLVGCAGLRVLKDFKSGVYIGGVLDQKQDALAQHQSQMEPLLPNTDWSTLGGVAEGAFLSCFFQEAEVFQQIS